MYPVSEAYKNAISQNERNVRIAGTITLKDNSVIQIDDKDILQGSLYFTEQCVSGEDIEIGNVYASEMGLTLTSPPENPYSLDGARIIVNFGIDVSEDGSGVYEYVPLGYFYVTEIERKHTAVNLKALDGMILFDTDLSGVLTTGTPFTIISSCCTKAGVTLATSSAEFESFANGQKVFAVPVGDKIKTCRDLIMWVCQLLGAFARMNRLGQLEIIPITGRAPVKTISKDERFVSDVSDFYVKISKVSMKVGETEYSQGTAGMTMVLEENPLLAGKSEAEINAALAEILAQVTEAEYTPYNLTCAGDPALQAGDWVTLAETGTLTGGDIVSIVTHHSWRYRGPHEIRAAGKSGLLRGVQAQQSKTVSSIRALAKAAQDLAQAANQSTQLINDAIGGHVLIRQSPDEGETNEILIMDNPDPELATKIWRWNLGGLGYSDNVVGADNPDRDYDVAMTMDGAINADFVRTGKLIADVVQIGAGTTFEPGYDPLQTNQALKSLADGTYTGGAFIDGTTLYSPNIVGLNILGMTGEFDRLWAGDRQGAHVEIGEVDGLPFISLHDDEGNVVTGYTKQGIMMDSRGRIAFPYLDGGAGEIRTYRVEGRRVLMLRGDESTTIVPKGGGINIFHSEDRDYAGQVVIHGGGAVAMRIMADQSAQFYGDVQVDGNAFFDGAVILREGYIEVRADAGTHAQIKAVGGSGRQGIRLTGQADTGAGVIYIYGNSDSTNPGQVLIYSGGSSTLRMYNDQSVRFYGDLRYDGGLYQGSTRGIPAADIRSGAVTESKIGSGAVTSAKIAANAVTSAKTSGATTVALKLIEQTTAHIVELTFTNGLLTSWRFVS
jgi:hypothetical protein